MSENVVKTIEVTKLPAQQRHGTIIQSFIDLEPHQAFEIVVDHDPKPLYYQFAFEHKGRFTWEYLEGGPEVWRVRIGKTDGTTSTTGSDRP